MSSAPFDVYRHRRKDPVVTANIREDSPPPLAALNFTKLVAAPMQIVKLRPERRAPHCRRRTVMKQMQGGTRGA
jgi:hypothetical protein